MFALCFVFGGMMLVRAQDTTSNQYKTEQQSQYPQDQQAQQDRQRIQTSELPDAVKRSLEDQEYRGWLVSGAFTASADQSMQSDSTGVNGQSQGNNNAIGAEGEEIYLVELKNGAETKTVAFRKDGQRIEGWQDPNDQYNQNDQNNQYNQNDQMKQSDSTDQSSQQSQTPELQTTPPDQSGQSTSGDANRDTQH